MLLKYVYKIVGLPGLCDVCSSFSCLFIFLNKRELISKETVSFLSLRKIQDKYFFLPKKRTILSGKYIRHGNT